MFSSRMFALAPSVFGLSRSISGFDAAVFGFSVAINFVFQFFQRVDYCIELRRLSEDHHLHIPIVASQRGVTLRIRYQAERSGFGVFVTRPTGGIESLFEFDNLSQEFQVFECASSN